MDLLDSLAFWARKYEQQTVAGSGSPRFTLRDLLDTFGRNAIFELTPRDQKGAGATVKPDPVRKMKVSLLDDGVSAIHSSSEDWFEVFRTGPSGDLAKVKIVAHSAAGPLVGEIRMLIGRRSYDHYFREDPIFDALARNAQ